MSSVCITFSNGPMHGEATKYIYYAYHQQVDKTLVQHEPLIAPTQKLQFVFLQREIRDIIYESILPQNNY